MSIEAMKQALEALSYVMSHGVAVQQAKDILLEAIEQAEKREWQGLTDEEISAVDWKQNETLHDFAHAIEAKLKEKNA
jgi:hypothetical protein